MGRKITLRGALAVACSRRALRLSMGFGLVLAAAAPALAQTAANAPVNLDLGSVLAAGTATGSADYQDTPGTAPYEAPSVTPLNSTQPTSLVNRHTITNNFTGQQTYSDYARLTPSVSAISPNGPGLSETNGPVIRGFQDGQYNVTYDGIPIGDSNDFTHHTTSFFMGNDIGSTIVDRGPGTAETVGDATFGGTISIRTKDPLPVTTLTPYGEYGSYNTGLQGLELDTGAIQAANGTSAFVDAEHLQSSGALKYAHQERSNFFGKIVIPVSSNTTITLLADYNKLYQNPPLGATLSQMAAFGHNFAYSDDPTQQNYYRYNNDHITTDMEYIDLQSNFGDGFLYDGKIYTYAYYHQDLNGDDPNDTLGDGITQAVANGAIPNEVVLTPGGTPQAGVPGETFTNSYRSVGTIQRIQKDFSFGDIKAGVWLDHQVDTRNVAEVSLTNGNAPNYDPADANGGVGINPDGTQKPGYNNALGTISRLQHNELLTFQPYGQFDWKPIDGLTVTAGAKYAFFKRGLNAQVNQKTELPVGYEHNYDKLLPSFEIKYSFTPNLSAYGQAAEGFLAPNLNTYYTTALTTDSLKPQSTLNFQAGLAYQDEHLALSGDVYNIHFQNFINSKKVVVNNTKQTVFFNNGGVIYRGVEGEAAYTLDSGFTMFANAGYNEAFQTSTNIHITNAPQFTTNAGIIYDKNGIYASVIDQWTGGSYTGNTGTNIANGAPEGSGANGKSPGGWYDPYNIVNLSAGYTFNNLNPHLNQTKVTLNLDNITNQKQIISDNGTNGAGDLLYFVLPGVSAFVSVSVPITF